MANAPGTAGPWRVGCGRRCRRAVGGRGGRSGANGSGGRDPSLDFTRSIRVIIGPLVKIGVEWEFSAGSVGHLEVAQPLVQFKEVKIQIDPILWTNSRYI